MQEFIYRVAKVLAKSGVFLVSFLAFLGVLVVAVTQMEPFRKWAIDQGLERVNEILKGRLSVEDIDGNLLNGLTLKGVRLEAGDTTFAFVPKIELRYELLPILESRSVGASLILFQPEVYLHRTSEGVWNFTEIAYPSPDSLDEPHTPLEWIFDVRSLELRDGIVTIDDDLSRNGPTPGDAATVDPLNTTLRQFNLEAATYISEEYQRFLIRHLSFVETTSGLRLIDLAGDIDIDAEEGVAIDGLRLETEGSYLELDATVATPGLFDSTFGGSFTTAPFTLALAGERIDIDEISRFIPAMTILAGTVALDLEASGVLEEMTVERFTLEASGTTVRGEGRLLSITDPEAMQIDATLEDSDLSYADVARHLPGVDLSAVSYLRQVEITTLHYSGRSDDATATFDIATSVGSVVGGGTFHYGSEPFRWRADLRTEELNLTEVTAVDGSPALVGEVTGRIVGEGIGVDPQTMKARVRSRLGRSEIEGRKIDRAWIEGSFGEGGLIELDTVLVAFRTESAPAAPEAPELTALHDRLVELRDRAMPTSFIDRISIAPGEGLVFDGRPSLRGSGWFDMRDPDLPTYRGRIETDRLNLSDITLDPEHDTRLGLMATFEGRGIDPDEIEGYLQLDAYDVELPGGEEVLPFRIDSLLLERIDGERRLLLASDIADAEIVGTWRFASLFPTLAAGFEKLSNYIARKSSYRSTDIDFFSEEDEGVLEPISATWRFEPKDLSIVEAFMPGKTIEMDADLSGTISGTPSLLSMTARGRIERFLYREGETSYRFGGIELDADVRNISSGAMDDLLDAEISIRSDSVYRFGDTDLEIPNLDLVFRDGRLNLRGDARIDNEYDVTLDGTVDVVAEEGYRIRLDSIAFALDEQLRWANVGPVQLMIDDQGITFREVTIGREGAEQVAVSGRLVNFERFENVEVRLSSMPLAQLQPFVSDLESKQMIESLGGRFDSVAFLLGGTLESPVIDGHLEVRDLRYANVTIGSIVTDLDYSDRVLSGQVKIVANRADTLSGSDIPILADVTIERLPIDLAFAAREERFVQGEPISIRGVTDELPLAILGPFVPGILIQRGTTDLEFQVRGRLPDVDYSGTGRIMNGMVLVESTNVPYLVDARFELAEERLELNGVSLRNLPSDYAPGRATAFGNITFDGFSPQNFNIQIRTAGLMVLNDATQAVNDLYYGDLVIATRQNGTLTFGGTYARPTLTGDLIVLESDLKYPYRDRISELQGRVDFLPYEEWIEESSEPAMPMPQKEIPDSVRKARGMDRLDSMRIADSLRKEGRGRPVVEADEDFEIDFMDRLFVNLAIYVPRGVRLTIEIGLLQQLELIIDDGPDERPLQFSMLGDAMSLTGEVRLLQGSKFIFVRTFDATGSIVFDQNILNPAFDIQGEYKGRRYMNGVNQNFTVELFLDGTLERPEIGFDYTIEGVASNDDLAQKQTDAILLLLVGRRQSEFGGGSEEELAADAFLSGADALGTNVLGAALGGVFADIGGLQTVEFDGNIDDPGGTTFRFVYAVGDALLRYEGRITQLSDGTVTVELPLELLLNISQFKNLSLELQRAVVDEFGSTFLPNQTSSSTEQVFRVRLSLRYTF